MRTHPARALTELVLGFIAILVLFTIVWFVAPEAQPILLVGALAVTVVLTLAMYVIQRRRHW